MRILYVIDSMTHDGAETQLLRTLENLNPKHHEAFVVLSREAGAHHDRLEALPVVHSVAVLESQTRLTFPSIVEKAFKLGGLAKAVQPDVIHSWLWYSNFLCGIARRLALLSDTPLIISQRGDYHARYGRARLWLTEKFIYNPARVIVTNSHEIANQLGEPYPDKRIETILNLVEWSKLPYRPASEGHHIVSVGRLAPEKGHEHLIHALHLLITTYDVSNVTATIFGDGAMKSKLQTLINRYGLSDCVRLPGFCDDICSVLAKANLFVLPSLHESSPNALIEAMGAGLPCIASHVGGIPDLIEQNKSGLTVPPANPKAVAEAIYRLLTDVRFAAQLGKNARTKVRQMFDNDQSIRQLEGIYQEVALHRDLTPGLGS